ncbi:MAG: hypothetical protein AAFS03_12200, partial [Pseudomonadota bacterium]
AELQDEKPLHPDDVALFKSIADAAPEDQPVDELAWRRLQRSIAATKQDAAASEWWQRPVVSTWQMAAAIAAALAVGLVMPALQETVGDQPTYATASEAPVETAGVTARIVFNPNATMAEVEALLSNLDLSIVSGPSAVGLYTVQHRPGDETPFPTQDLNASNLVEHVEVPGEETKEPR